MPWLAIATGVLKAVGAFFGWREKEAEIDLRDMDREAGAAAQQNADLKKAVATKDAQLAVAAKADDTREELLAKAKQRKRR